MWPEDDIGLHLPYLKTWAVSLQLLRRPDRHIRVVSRVDPLVWSFPLSFVVVANPLTVFYWLVAAACCARDQ